MQHFYRYADNPREKKQLALKLASSLNNVSRRGTQVALIRVRCSLSLPLSSANRLTRRGARHWTSRGSVAVVARATAYRNPYIRAAPVIERCIGISPGELWPLYLSEHRCRDDVWPARGFREKWDEETVV